MKSIKNPNTMFIYSVEYQEAFEVIERVPSGRYRCYSNDKAPHIFAAIPFSWPLVTWAELIVLRLKGKVHVVHTRPE